MPPPRKHAAEPHTAVPAQAQASAPQAAPQQPQQREERRPDHAEAAPQSAPSPAQAQKPNGTSLPHHGSFAAPGSPSSQSASLVGSPQLTAASSAAAIAAPSSSSSSTGATALPRPGSNGVSIFSHGGTGQSAFRPPLHKVRSVLSGEEADSEPSSAGSSARGSGGGMRNGNGGGGGHSESGNAIADAAHRAPTSATDLAAALSLSSHNSGSSHQLSQMAMAASGAGAVLRAMSRPKAHSFDQPSRNNNPHASGPLFETEQLSSGGESAPASAVKPPHDPQWKQSSSSLNLLLSSHLRSLFPTPAASSAAAPPSSGASALFVNTASPSPPPPPAAPGLLRSIFSPFVHWTPRGTAVYMLASLVLARLVRIAGRPARVNRTMLTFGPPFLVREAPQLFALLIAFGLFRTAHQQRACFPSIPLLVAWVANATSLVGLCGLFAQMVRTGARNFRQSMAAAGIPLPQVSDAHQNQDQESVLTIAAATHDAKGEIHPRVVAPAPAPASTPADSSSAALSPTAVSAYRRLGKMTPLRWFLTVTQLTKTLAWYEEVQWKSGVIFEKIYTKHKTHALKLDIYRPKSTGEIKPLPVFLYIHGGGWVTGHRSFHSLALLYAICKSGWLVISVSYRLSPWVKHPTHLMDCKRSLAWVKQHAKELGADGSTIVVGGESAGAHLACLLALTPNIPYLQPGFEQVDTSVAGVVDLYGPHDFTDSNYHFRCHEDPHSVFGGFDVFLHRMVMGIRLDSNPGDYAMASPLFRLHSFPDKAKRIPPFFACHGTADDLVPVGDSDAFYRQLRKKRAQARREYDEAVMRFEAEAASTAAVNGSNGSGGISLPPPLSRSLPPLAPFCLRHGDVYVRVPGASHAFNNVMGPRSFALNDSVTAWLLALLTALRERRTQVAERKDTRARASEHSASVLEDYSTANAEKQRQRSSSDPHSQPHDALEAAERRQAEEEERADRQQRAAAAASDEPLFLVPKL